MAPLCLPEAVEGLKITETESRMAVAWGQTGQMKGIVQRTEIESSGDSIQHCAYGQVH